MLPSEISNILSYTQRATHHWRSRGANEAFNKLPQEAQEILRPFLTGNYPDEDLQLSLWQKVKAVVSTASTATAGTKTAEAGETSPAAKPKKRGLFSQPRRVSKAIETWRCLNNYPNYEVSSHGRVRAIDRANPNDWLKPRRKWYKGMCPDSVVLKDRDGNRREVFVGKLLIAAGFMAQPKFMKQAV